MKYEIKVIQHTLYKDLTGNVGEKSYSHPAHARRHGLSTNYGSGTGQHVPTLKAPSRQNGLPLLATLVLYHGPNMTYAATVLERQRWGTYALESTATPISLNTTPGERTLVNRRTVSLPKSRI